MRDRKTIEQDTNAEAYYGREGNEDVLARLSLEVLLDIRDLLEASAPQPEHRVVGTIVYRGQTISKLENSKGAILYQYDNFIYDTEERAMKALLRSA